jgi:penicillin-binding protein 1A
MLDMLWQAANKGTGRRAAVRAPSFGKTGTSQANRDALFIGFAGNLVVGVWVGRDDNKSLGKITGGTVPAAIWHDFMTSALAIEGSRGPALPKEFKLPAREVEKPTTNPSPVPDEWSDSTRPLRELARLLDNIFGN